MRENMSKPIIGLLPLVDTDKDSYWMLPGYMKGIEEAGGIPVMLPLTSEEIILQQIVQTFDGFLFTGGQDVSPSLYGREKSRFCGECSIQRDQMEQRMLRFLLQIDKPILGICRGIQILNAALGGTLYQDLPTEHPSDLKHRQSPPYEIPVHKVDFVQDTPIKELLQKESLYVNSCHHQAIQEISPRLQPMAYSEDGLIEAAWMPDKTFVWGVQWHPELSYPVDDNSLQLFKQFVQAAFKNLRSNTSLG